MFQNFTKPQLQIMIIIIYVLIFTLVNAYLHSVHANANDTKSKLITPCKFYILLLSDFKETNKSSTQFR